MPLSEAAKASRACYVDPHFSNLTHGICPVRATLFHGRGHGLRLGQAAFRALDCAATRTMDGGTLLDQASLLLQDFKELSSRYGAPGAKAAPLATVSPAVRSAPPAETAQAAPARPLEEATVSASNEPTRTKASVQPADEAESLDTGLLSTSEHIPLTPEVGCQRCCGKKPLPWHRFGASGRAAHTIFPTLSYPCVAAGVAVSALVPAGR